MLGKERLREGAGAGQQSTLSAQQANTGQAANTRAGWRGQAWQHLATPRTETTASSQRSTEKEQNVQASLT